MKWKTLALGLLAAALLVLCACAGKTGEPSIGDLTRPPVGGETVRDTPEPEPETAKDTAPKGDKTASGKGETEEPETPETDAGSSVVMDGPQVRAMWANGEWNGDYDWIDLSTGEPVSTILFVADSTVTDFQISSLFLEDVDDYGNMDFSVTPLYTQEALTPDWALVVDLTFYGDLPSYGISYTDANGTFWCFAIEISGYDGSIVLSEF